jgi:hypothetical protein
MGIAHTVTVRTQALVPLRQKPQRYITICSFASGCAIVQAITRLTTAAVWVQFLVSSCGSESGIRKFFSNSLVSVINYLSTSASLLSSVIRIWFNGPFTPKVPRDSSLIPT